MFYVLQARKKIFFLYRARTHSFDCRFSHAGLASLFICRIEFSFFSAVNKYKKKVLSVYIVRYWYIWTHINFILLNFFSCSFFPRFFTPRVYCNYFFLYIYFFFLSGATNNNTSIPLFTIFPGYCKWVHSTHSKKFIHFYSSRYFFLYFFFCIACSFFLISTRGESQKLAKFARLSSKNFCLSPRIAIFLLQANRDLVSGNFL